MRSSFVNFISNFVGITGLMRIPVVYFPFSIDYRLLAALGCMHLIVSEELPFDMCQ